MTPPGPATGASAAVTSGATETAGPVRSGSSTPDPADTAALPQVTTAGRTTPGDRRASAPVRGGNPDPAAVTDHPPPAAVDDVGPVPLHPADRAAPVGAPGVAADRPAPSADQPAPSADRPARGAPARRTGPGRRAGRSVWRGGVPLWWPMSSRLPGMGLTRVRRAVGAGGVTVTARGSGLLVGAAAALTVGFRFGYPDLAVLGTAGGCAALAALAHAAWRPRLDVTRVADPDRVERGRPATMTVTVRNASRVRAANLVAVDRCAGLAVPVPLLRLRPGRDTTVRYPVPTDRRGILPVGPLAVVRRDALGLVSVARGYGEPASVRVHPRIHPLAAVPAGATRSLDGRIDNVAHGTITFDALREYVVGDELRRVHWRTSARVGELMVREHLDTSLPRIVVVLDDRAGAHPERRAGSADSFEAACEAAASVVAAAVREDVAVSLHLVAGSGRGGYLDVLTEAVLQESVGHAGDPLLATTRLLRQQRLGDTLVFLTGPGGRADLGAVGGLRGPYPVVVVGLFGPGDPGAAGTGPGAGGGPSAGSGGAAGANRAVGSDGVVVFDVRDGAEFASAWDGSSTR